MDASDSSHHVGVATSRETRGDPPAAALPTGTVTFLFTDIEGSTRLWETVPDAMARALALHNETLFAAFERNGGVVYSTMGDGMAVAFRSAAEATRAVVEAQRALTIASWPSETGVLKVRMGVHTDDAVVHDGRYLNPPLNRCARLMAAAHGGQSLMSDATEALARAALPDGVSLVDLGVHRLRDLREPVHVFQITHPDIPRTVPSLRSVDAPAGNLPVEASSFIGRTSERTRVESALEEARLVTLVGVGGVGKTRLAVEVAGEVLLRYADGAWLCELAPVRDGSSVVDAVAAVFAVTARAGETIAGSLVDFLRSKRLLLVLDNCEHLLADVAPFVARLTASCRGLVILATTRERLGIEGERVIAVAPLPTPEVDADLTATLDADAVRLFVDRAAAVMPDFVVTAQNAQAVAAVCRLLDGVPLAIELAAARVPAMTPAELAARLDRRFAVLTGGSLGAPEHHRTLRAAIDWSFDLLTDPEQRLLARLAVFAGGCTLEAVEDVCSGDGIETDSMLDWLANLVARSLVVAEQQGPRTRYRLLETIRQYAEDRLDEAGDTERRRARHADYYTRFLADIRHDALDRDGVFWALRLAAEHENLLAAWSAAIRTANVDAAFAMLAGFAPYEVWNTSPLPLPAEAALGLPDATAHERYPLALAVCAVFVSNRGDAAGAEELCRRARAADAERDPRDWRVEEAVCAARQNIATSRGAFTDAARIAERAARIAESGGDLADASAELSSSAACYVLAGDATRGAPLAREALALARRIRAPALIATSLLEVGATVADASPDEARACLDESLELSAALGYQKARDLVWATGIATLIDDRATTLELGRRALQALDRSGDRLRMAIILHMLANALAPTEPEAAATIDGAAETVVVQPEGNAQLLTAALTAALGDERARALRARGAEMEWDEVLTYTVSRIAEAMATA